MSDCDVCLYSEADGYWEFFVSGQRTCRKPFKCHECSREVAKGERYAYVGGKFDGDMWREKLCLACDEILRVFSCDGPVIYGNLWDEMQEHVFPKLTTGNKCFQELSANAKNYLLHRWQEWKGLR